MPRTNPDDVELSRNFEKIWSFVWRGIPSISKIGNRWTFFLNLFKWSNSGQFRRQFLYENRRETSHLSDPIGKSWRIIISIHFSSLPPPTELSISTIGNHCTNLFFPRCVHSVGLYGSLPINSQKISKRMSFICSRVASISNIGNYDSWWWQNSCEFFLSAGAPPREGFIYLFGGPGNFESRQS